MYKSVSESPKSYTPIPDKLFYKIGEVSKIVGVEPYVLRYWETEFPFLKPRKNRSGQRVYVKKDLELILQVKRLLYQERYTIEGVRKRFGGSSIHIVDPTPTSHPARVLEHIKKRLREILSLLNQVQDR